MREPAGEPTDTLIHPNKQPDLSLSLPADQYDSNSSNPFFYMLVVSRLFSSCFVFWWDMVMDWGMFDKNSGEFKFLREELVYSSPVSGGSDSTYV